MNKLEDKWTAGDNALPARKEIATNDANKSIMNNISDTMITTYFSSTLDLPAD